MSKLIKGVGALRAIAAGEKVEFLRNDKWEDAIYCQGIQFIQDVFEFRIKPNLIKIGDIEIEAPVSEMLSVGTVYYIPSLTSSGLFESVTWCDYARDLGNLQRRIVHLSVENAIAHTSALIMVGGGEIQFVDVSESEPAPVKPDPEPAEKKRRVKKEPVVVDAPIEEAGSIDISADISFESETVHEPKPDIPFESFVTPASVEFDEPQPEEIVAEPVPVLAANDEVQAVVEDTSESAKRVRYLLEDIAKAKTGGEVMIIKTRYTTGLNESDLKIVIDAMAKRNSELAGFPQQQPAIEPKPEQPSLAARIAACTDIAELVELLPEIEFLDPLAQPRMLEIYDARRLELLANNAGKDGVA